jgi:hypothetical protein
MPRTINDIIPPSRRRPEASQPAPQMPSVEAPFAPVPPPPPAPAPFAVPRRRFPWGTAVFALIVVILVAGALYAFAGAKIEITPTENAVTLSGSFTATPQSGDLPFETISVEKVASTTVPAESTATVQQSAQGSVVISNTQSTAQQLITNTRFQSPDGLIFRIHQAVTVPAGSASAPGQLTVTVYADQPGDQYNIAATTFTVPGLKGSAAYDAVTAKSAAAFTGGFSGQRGTVSAATDDATHAKLQATLAASIQSALEGQVPQGYVLVPGAAAVTYQPQPDGAASDGSVAVSESADATAVVFPRDAFARAVAAQAVSGYAGQPVTLADVSGLTLAAASSTQQVGQGPFSFTLSGATTVLWTVDSSKIAGAVSGKTREEARTTLGTFPEVAKAYIVLRPFWASAFPTDPAKITVTVDNPS